MLGDNLTFSYDGNSLVLPKISSTPGENGNILTTYRNADGTFQVTVGRESQKPAFTGGPPRIRRTVIFTRFFTATDPLTAQVKKIQSSAQFVMNDLEWGISDADVLKLNAGLIALMGVSGLQAKVLGDET